MTQTVVNVPAVAGGGGKMGEGDFFSTTAGGNITIDLSNGYYQRITLNAAITDVAFSAVPASEGRSVVVDFIQPSSGTTYGASFPGIKFDSGIAPTLSTGNSDIDRIAFDLVNDGSTTTEYGHVLGLDMQ
jgi:hypothetical protein